MATSKWSNYFSASNGTMTNTGDRDSLTTYSPTATQYKRLRHIKMSIVAQVDTTGGRVAGLVCFWKGSEKLDPLISTTPTDLDLTDTAIFRRIPIALTDSNSYRFSTSWPKVSIDEDEKFQIFVTYSDSNVVGGARPEWSYSYTMTAMENLRTM